MHPTQLIFHFCPVTIALLAEDGQLVRLEEGIAQAPSMACSLLQEHGTYVLVQVISKWGPRFSFAAVLDYKGGPAGHRQARIPFSLNIGWVLYQCLS